MSKLIEGLEKLIEFVNTVPDGYEFDMNSFNNDIIGEYLEESYQNTQLEVLSDLFGIVPNLDEPHMSSAGLVYIFNEKSKKVYTEKEWDVIYLFSCDLVGCRVDDYDPDRIYITKEDWLNISTQELEKLK